MDNECEHYEKAGPRELHELTSKAHPNRTWSGNVWQNSNSLVVRARDFSDTGISRDTLRYTAVIMVKPKDSDENSCGDDHYSKYDHWGRRIT
jgi:hypothetical protein